jgi:hypothetical protein
MSAASLSIVTQEVQLAYPKIAILANSFVQQAQECGVITPDATITSEYFGSVGTFIIRNVLRVGYVDECIETVQRIADPASIATDRTFNWLTRRKGSRAFGDSLDMLAMSFFSVEDPSFGDISQVRIGVNRYDQDDGKGGIHTDELVSKPFILLGRNPGYIELADCVVENEVFEAMSSSGDTVKIEYGAADVVFSAANLFTHRGVGTDPNKLRETVVAWSL